MSDTLGTIRELIIQDKKARDLGMNVRGPVDHGFIHSIYFRDPNGYVVELSAPVGDDSPESKACLLYTSDAADE